MKLIKTLHQYKARFLTKFRDGDIQTKSLISLAAVVLVSIIIWFGGPLLIWGDYQPLILPQKRMYIISALVLLWTLKYLILDLDTPSPSQYRDPATRKKIEMLQKRFSGAMQFLKKTTISRFNKNVRLNQLPWYLLIGPPGAGKTTLLANSNINFILHRQFSHPLKVEPSDHCDWWVTKDASIIDVPARYFAEPLPDKRQPNPVKKPILWDYFLRLVKDQRGSNAINGMIIALPLPEIMKLGDMKRYQAMVAHIFRRLHEMQQQFPETIPCYLMITKCDLLPGFVEYFAESGNDEIAQAWGVMLPQPKPGEKLHDLFAVRLNALIKKLNQQLLWRLHQERNPMARPYIKDFPLQVEKLKELLLDFVKRYSNEHFNFYMKGVYLNSAMQEAPDEEESIIEENINNTQRAVQIFKEPAPESRAYFVRQFLTHALSSQDIPVTQTSPAVWKKRAAYAASATVITAVAVTLGKDFRLGVQQTRVIQRDFADYQLAVAQFQNSDEHLQKTIVLLNELRKSAKDANFKVDLATLMSFYSKKSLQKANLIYQQALQNMLLPEVKNYLGDYLKNPINKNSDLTYAVLKSYLMLGDLSHLEKTFLTDTLHSLLPKNMDANLSNQLFYHLNLALNATRNPQILDHGLIEQARRYLLSLQNIDLAYVILKNINNNNANSPVNLGAEHSNKSILVSNVPNNQIPAMFTAKFFPTTFSQDVNIAAQEALTGDWILGDNNSIPRSAEEINVLAQQLRTAYVTNYANMWENLLTQIQLTTPKNLKHADKIITNLISDNSPLLQLLQTLHENTYFEPITTTSQKLLDLGALVEKSNTPQNQLYQILVGLESLHQYIQPVITSDEPEKAAFQLVSKRMMNQDGNDTITKVRIIAKQSPEPIKTWLEKITNEIWHSLMNSSTHYIDVSWQEQIGQFYRTELANRFPFSPNATKEVDLQKFTKFFGNPGLVADFYNYYLQNFVDTSGTEWHWKQIDGDKFPFSDDSLRQIQQAIKIHHAFFPKGDAVLAVDFTLQPYSVAKSIKSIKVNINSKTIAENKAGNKLPHTFTWPNTGDSKQTTVLLTLQNQKTVSREFPGEWGWFKLVNQTFDSAVSRKQMMVNFSLNNSPAKYIVLTNGQFNPVMTMNLNHFKLPPQLTQKS